ncbi:MAG: histidine phosphatase family protein [Bacteroidales bacterium]
MNTPTELYLLRHGETQWNLEKRFQGQMDSPLTENGILQAKNLAILLREIRFDALYSSDLGRAVETARILNEVLHIPLVKTEVLLRERDFGKFHGMSRQEVEESFPEEGKRIWSGPASEKVPGGESRTDVHHRAVQFLSMITAEHPAHRVLAVSHGGIVNALIREVMQIPLDAPRRFKLPNTAINVFALENNTWYLKSLGIVSHLGNGIVYDETI